jgi:hypothetical protein
MGQPGNLARIPAGRMTHPWFTYSRQRGQVIPVPVVAEHR